MTTRLIEECLTIDEICNEIPKTYPVIFVVDTEAGRSLMKKMSGIKTPGQLIPLSTEEFNMLRNQSAIFNWRF